MGDEKNALVVVFPRGQLLADDKAQMREAGIIAVEADQPDKVQQLHLTQPLLNTRINGDGVVRAALLALTKDVSINDAAEMARAAHRFVKNLAETIAKETP